MELGIIFLVIGLILIGLVVIIWAINPGGSKTYVYLRENKGTRCRHWESKVYYDVWNSPYVKNHGGFSEIALRPDNTTSDTFYWGTEWKHKSGPPVIFGKRPERPFDRDL